MNIGSSDENLKRSIPITEMQNYDIINKNFNVNQGNTSINHFRNSNHLNRIFSSSALNKTDRIQINAVKLKDGPQQANKGRYDSAMSALYVG